MCLDLNVTKLSKWIWTVRAGVCSRVTQASLNANVAAGEGFQSSEQQEQAWIRTHLLRLLHVTAQQPA